MVKIMNKDVFDKLIKNSFNRIKVEKNNLSYILIDTVRGRQAKFFIEDQRFEFDSDEIDDIIKEYPDISETQISDIIISSIIHEIQRLSFKPFADQDIVEGLESIKNNFDEFLYEVNDNNVIVSYNKKFVRFPKTVLNNSLMKFGDKEKVFEEMNNIFLNSLKQEEEKTEESKILLS